MADNLYSVSDSTSVNTRDTEIKASCTSEQLSPFILFLLQNCEAEK